MYLAVLKHLKFLLFQSMCLVLCCSLLGHGLITRPPDDTEARVGTRIVFQCATDPEQNSIEWHHKPVGSDSLRTVYLEGFIYQQYQGRFTVEKPSTAQFTYCNLIISNVMMVDAGNYVCMQNSDEKSAELIVFDVFPSDQSCFASSPPNGIIGNNDCGLKPDSLNLSCKMNYRGNILPKMEWRDGQGRLLDAKSSNENGTNMSTVNVVASSVENITCHINYSTPGIQSEIMWTFSIYTLALVNCTGVKNTTCQQSNIPQCDKAENPECPGKLQSGNGSRLDGFSLENLPTGKYECNAECDIRGQNCILHQLTIHHECSQNQSEKDSPMDHPAVIILPVICAVIFVAAAGAIYRVVKKKIHKKRKEMERRKQKEMERRNSIFNGDAQQLEMALIHRPAEEPVNHIHV